MPYTLYSTRGDAIRICELTESAYHCDYITDGCTHQPVHTSYQEPDK